MKCPLPRLTAHWLLTQGRQPWCVLSVVRPVSTLSRPDRSSTLKSAGARSSVVPVPCSRKPALAEMRVAGRNWVRRLSIAAFGVGAATLPAVAWALRRATGGVVGTAWSATVLFEGRTL